MRPRARGEGLGAAPARLDPAQNLRPQLSVRALFYQDLAPEVSVVRRCVDRAVYASECSERAFVLDYLSRLAMY